MKINLIFIILILILTPNLYSQSDGTEDGELYKLVSQEIGDKYEILQLDSNVGIFEQIIEVKNTCESIDLKKFKKEQQNLGSMTSVCLDLEPIFSETFSSENIAYLKSQISKPIEIDRSKGKNNNTKIVRVTKPIYNISRNIAFVSSIRGGGFFTGVYIKSGSAWKFKAMLSAGIF
jgi:hypothetical protein